jgi:hypothetical protein
MQYGDGTDVFWVVYFYPVSYNFHSEYIYIYIYIYIHVYETILSDGKHCYIYVSFLPGKQVEISGLFC